jgi:AcrR family transcriptional regulator
VFAERGYQGASIDEIARRAGVSAPVVYDHFASKQDLFQRLLVRTRDELLEMWREHLFSDEPAAVRIPRAFAAWAEYAAEVMRAGLTGLAIWWNDHPHVPRERIVATAVSVLWTGFERASEG